LKKKIEYKRVNLTIEEAFPRFVISQTAKGVSDKTLQTYKGHFRALSRHLDMSISFDDLTRDDLDNMLVSLRSSGVAPNTISSYIRVFRTFLRWCRMEELTTLDVPCIQNKETVKDTYTDAELAILLRRPDRNCDFCEYRSWVMVNFFLNSGCRAGTIRNIQNRDVDLSNRQAVYRHVKTGRLQATPLCSQLVKILSDYMAVRGGAPEDYLFCNEYGEMLTHNALRLAIRRYNHRRGVTKTSLHMFRHTFARKYLMDCHGDAFTLQKLLGHSTLAMTKHYCAIYDSDLAEHYDDHSPLAQMIKPRDRITK